MAETIGIKIANGDFYPIIIGEDTTVKKRLVLTTVHDRQESVQIDLFRSITRSMQDARYIGSLVVENIRPRSRGEPSIEMVISCDLDGNITAKARDLDAGVGGEHHILNVSLKTMDKFEQESSFPDFDFGEKPTPMGLYDQPEFAEEEKRRSPWLIVAFVTLFVIFMLALLWFFFLGGRDRPPFGGTAYDPVPLPRPPVAEQPIAPPPVVETTPPVVAEEPPARSASVPEEVVIIQAPVTPPPERPRTAERKRPPAPVSSYKVPTVIPRNGAPYQVRWGDTLWDISEAFYRNPWLYPRIARFNNISNPDHIIAGKTIRVPPRN